MITKYLEIDTQTESKLHKFIESSNNKSWERKRALAILMSSTKTTVNQIAKKLEMAPDTIYDWLIKFTNLGIEGLKDKPKSGRPRKIRIEHQEDIKKVLKKSSEC